MRFNHLGRREFVTLLGGSAAWPLAARAQQPDRMQRIGVLMGFAESDPEVQAFVAAFRVGLEKLGWAERRNIRIGSKLNLNANAERVRSEQIGPSGFDVLPNPHRQCLGRKWKAGEQSKGPRGPCGWSCINRENHHASGARP